jgi:hypothetical protein
MSLGRHFRIESSAAKWIRAALAFIVLLGIGTARSIPSQFSDASEIHSRIGAVAQHDQRPRFDDSALRWNAPAASFVLFSPTVKSVEVTPAEPDLFSTLQATGFHFNRPPPVT